MKRTLRKSVRAFVRGVCRNRCEGQISQVSEPKRENGHFVRVSADSPRPWPRTLPRIYLIYAGVRAGCPRHGIALSEALHVWTFQRARTREALRTNRPFSAFRALE